MTATTITRNREVRKRTPGWRRHQVLPKSRRSVHKNTHTHVQMHKHYFFIAHSHPFYTPITQDGVPAPPTTPLPRRPATNDFIGRRFEDEDHYDWKGISHTHQPHHHSTLITPNLTTTPHSSHPTSPPHPPTSPPPHTHHTQPHHHTHHTHQPHHHPTLTTPINVTTTPINLTTTPHSSHPSTSPPPRITHPQSPPPPLRVYYITLCVPVEAYRPNSGCLDTLEITHKAKASRTPSSWGSGSWLVVS